jgi:site-specific recombinase XerD
VQVEASLVKAQEYWHREMATLATSTQEIYKQYFGKYLDYTGKTADELLAERIQEVRSDNKQVQRHAETTFKSFLALMRKFYKPKTMQNIYASVRSFYELHNYPLKMRKSDYPKGEGIGQLRATTQACQKVLAKANIPLKALTTTINDTGLGVSDIRHLKASIILDNPEAKIIRIQMLRQKTGDKIHTFLGEEAIAALKEYLKLRETGTANIPAETISRDSPLFRTWNKNVKTPTRTGLSSVIAQAFKRAGFKNMSAHSFRKKLQTTLEKSGMNTNWIDLVLGHQLINSRDAYSLPTDEELEEAYTKAYDTIRILPSTQPKENPQEKQPDIIEVTTLEEAKQAILNGYHQAGTFNGIGLYTK